MFPSLTSHQFLATTGIPLFLSLRHAHNFFSDLVIFLLFSGCFLAMVMTINQCLSSICRNFPMAIPQPGWGGPERTQHSLLDGSFPCFQGRRFILLDLRLCNKCFIFPKVCSCLNRDRLAGQQLLALSSITQGWSGTVCQFCTDNE